MKRITTSYFFFIAFACMAQEKEQFEHHCFFEERTFTLGIGASNSLDLGTFGINSRLYYNMGEKLCFGPEFSYFKSDEAKVYDINFISHYIFETKLVGIYPLLGLNCTIEERHQHEQQAFGLVFGGGFHRNFKKLSVFCEYSHVQSELKDDFITAGLMIKIK